MTKHNIYQYIQNFLGNKTKPTIFELGVHWAEDTERILSWSNHHSDYHGFEPDSRNIDIAREKLKEQGIVITLNHSAISRKEGKATLYLSDGTHAKSGNRMTGANSIRKPKEVVEKHQWIDFNGTEEVLTTCIDSYCKEKRIDHIDFIWSDIQGCEYDMIMGAKKMLPEIDLMLLEYSDLELYEGQKNLKEILTLLGKDWVVVARTPMDVLVRQKR
jgi:FkbM family methyltransferase